jgi:Putative transposase
VLGQLFRGLFLHYLEQAFQRGQLSHLSDCRAFRTLLDDCRRKKWVVYAKRPFGGPAQVLNYLGRYTHRVAISNNRLLSLEVGKVAFSWKQYRTANANLLHLSGVSNNSVERFWHGVLCCLLAR